MRENERIYKDLALVAPGTQLYEGLESILKAKTGALIAVGGDSPEMLELVSGGFRIDSEMHPPASLYELAKWMGRSSYLLTPRRFYMPMPSSYPMP